MNNSLLNSFKVNFNYDYKNGIFLCNKMKIFKVVYILVYNKIGL